MIVSSHMEVINHNLEKYSDSVRFGTFLLNRIHPGMLGTEVMETGK